MVAHAQNPDSYDALIELVDVLQSIDEAKPEAILNETSITDNNGGRILL